MRRPGKRPSTPSSSSSGSGNSGRAMTLPGRPSTSRRTIALHVDGKPRQDGVASFLASRGIALPPGSLDDGPGFASVQALGRLKDRSFLQRLEQHGVEIYAPAITLVRRCAPAGHRTAVVSSSNNCAAVMRAVGIAGLFDARVDGIDVARRSVWAGKPAPDAFLEAARRLGVAPQRAVVIEDAVAGVAAGRAGRFGLVIGVDRGGRRWHCARPAPTTSSPISRKSRSPASRDPRGRWSSKGFDPAQGRPARSALHPRQRLLRHPQRLSGQPSPTGCTTRRPTWQAATTGFATEIAGRIVENEDLVSLTDWTGAALSDRRRPTGRCCAVPRCSPTHKHRHRAWRADAAAALRRRPEGRHSALEERRLVSMDDMHRAGHASCV